MKTWENYKVDSINRLPGRAHFSSFPSKETALLNENKYTQAYKNLNGCWHFLFLEAPEYSPENFFATDFDTSQMDQITVPGNWQVQGIFPLIRRMYQRKTQQVFTNGHLL